MSSQPDPEQMGQLKQMAMRMLEDQILSWLDELRDRAEAQRSGIERQEIIDATRKIEKAGNSEDAIEDAIHEVNEEINTVVGFALEQHQADTPNSDKVTGQFQDLLVLLHDPQIREAILLAVDDEYRDDIREWFDQIGSVVWGFVDLANGDQTENAQLVLEIAAGLQGVDEEKVKQSFR